MWSWRKTNQDILHHWLLEPQFDWLLEPQFHLTAGASNSSGCWSLKFIWLLEPQFHLAIGVLIVSGRSLLVVALISVGGVMHKNPHLGCGYASMQKLYLTANETINMGNRHASMAPNECQILFIRFSIVHESTAEPHLLVDCLRLPTLRPPARARYTRTATMITWQVGSNLKQTNCRSLRLPK